MALDINKEWELFVESQKLTKRVATLLTEAHIEKEQGEECLIITAHAENAFDLQELWHVDFSKLEKEFAAEVMMQIELIFCVDRQLFLNKKIKFNTKFMATREFIDSLNIEENVFELLEDTTIGYLVHYAAPYTGGGEIKIPAGTKIVPYGPMSDEHLYVRLEEENAMLEARMLEQEKLAIPQLADRIGGFSLFISESQVKMLNIRFEEGGSRQRLLDIFKLLRGERIGEAEEEDVSSFAEFLLMEEPEPPFEPKLQGVQVLFNSTPLKGTKYVESLPDTICAHPDRYSDLAPLTVREVAERCDWPHINHLFRSDKRTYEAVKNCYKEASHRGVAEATNILGVLAYNDEHNEREGETFFKKAALHGSKNAMINMFTLLWTNQEYSKAARWLHTVLDMPKPSLICLYNLAYLSFNGGGSTECLMPSDLDFARQLLKKICDTNAAEICYDERGIPELAHKFLAYIHAHPTNAK